MLRDLRYALRGAIRRPGLTIAVAVILGLGIGVNVAVFTVVDRLLLRPPPHLRDPRSLVRIYIRQYSAMRGELINRRFVSFPEFLDIARHTGESEEVGAFTAPSTELVRVGESSVRVKTSSVSPNYFQLLGTRPVRGRFFGGKATETVSTPVAVISYNFWQRVAAGSERFDNLPLTVAGQRVTIIGVAPPGFTGVSLDAADVWLPVGLQETAEFGAEWRHDRHTFPFQIVARLHPGANITSITTVALRALREGSLSDPVDMGYAGVLAGSLVEARGPDQYQAGDVKTALLLYGMSGVVLLIACANVVNLILFRTIRRRREIAIRLALGVTRARLARQLVLDGLVLSIAGGANGYVLAWIGAGVLRRVLLPRVTWAESAVDARALLVVCLAAVAIGVVIGILPAVRATKLDVTSALHDTWRAGRVHASLLRRVLLVAQVALSIVLVVAAALFAHSWRRAASLELGLDASHIAVLDLDAGNMPAAELDALYAILEARVRSFPWVAATSRSTTVPFQSSTLTKISLPGVAGGTQSEEVVVFASGVTPDYFRTVGIPIRAGRSFVATDRAGAAPVAIISETAARTLWPNQNALGQCLRLAAGGNTCFRVVGIVGDVRRMRLVERPEPQIYIPLEQLPGVTDDAPLLVRTIGSAKEHLAALAAAMLDASSDAGREQRPTLFVLQQLIDHQTAPWRRGTMLFGVLGALAVCVAATGLYSAIAYDVAQRRREFGIRLALGAQPTRIVGLVLRDSLRIGLAGIGVGIAATLAGSRVLASLLFNTSPTDPLVLVAVSVFLLAVAALAAFTPAMMAARSDPSRSLRID